MRKQLVRSARLAGLVATCGMVFSGLSCVTQAAETAVSGVTWVGSTGAFGLLSPVVAQLGSGFDFLTDLYRLVR